MMEILVLGPGCDKCEHTKSLIESVLKEMNVQAKVRAITDMREILQYAIFMTPAMLINEEEIVVGRIPTKDEIRKAIKKRM